MAIVPVEVQYGRRIMEQVCHHRRDYVFVVGSKLRGLMAHRKNWDFTAMSLAGLPGAAEDQQVNDKYLSKDGYLNTRTLSFFLWTTISYITPLINPTNAKKCLWYIALCAYLLLIISLGHGI
jgi:hypothetical protein